MRFSSTLLRRTPDGADEIMTLYGTILAHGMGLDRIQVKRMIPAISESRLRTMMRVLEEEGRLTEANLSVVQFMRRHPVVAHWGETGLASSNMMTVEASRRLWNARIDPRTRNYAIGSNPQARNLFAVIGLLQKQAGVKLQVADLPHPG